MWNILPKATHIDFPSPDRIIVIYTKGIKLI